MGFSAKFINFAPYKYIFKRICTPKVFIKIEQEQKFIYTPKSVYQIEYEQKFKYTNPDDSRL